MMIIFWIICYLIKTYLIYLVYQDMSGLFSLPILNYIEILLILNFGLMIKCILGNSSYADFSVYKKFTIAEKVTLGFSNVLIILMLASLHILYQIFL
ncbi:hypothetical protein LP123_07385 [Moraxella bovis]|uniref:Uncharacterized protein n=1 Tax=Moraxella bovis TaxID=476 RepID=A0ABY6MAB8_MORBO|nr:hypothetical protein [Moraxella bovis]AWY19938.1 hypothetical protein DQF64_05140 [Moraxella bovis]UYZ69986.1 hypothetical protein LP089_07485 [Moraxella bovis]UYZ74930.1 hypothetical protein LP093_09130 [Moraxella bovis]UYZ79142.1 hypothetical protein LP115_04735 [Moraxella bovis]UYZ79547.1 hypothetical protein LP115_06940 [Moraxella bovis]